MIHVYSGFWGQGIHFRAHFKVGLVMTTQVVKGVKFRGGQGWSWYVPMVFQLDGKCYMSKYR